MKAIVLREVGGPDKVQYEEVSDPIPKEGEVLIRLHAAALNRRDVYITQGLYHGIQLPAIMGGDGAGEVVGIGRNVTEIAIGDEVMIYPGFNWGDDPRVNGPDFTVLGVPADGTFAQLVAVPAENVFRKPSYLTWEEAASITLGGVTAYRAIVTRGKLQKDETVIIPGVGGGVATLLVQIAAALGAKVFVTSSKEEKIQRAIELGAMGGVNYQSKTWVQELRDMTGGADLSVDSIGGEQFNTLLSLAKPGSRIVTFGSTKGRVPNLLLPRVFLKQIDILGTSSGGPDECRMMIEFFKEHEIHPVLDQTFPLEQTKEALIKLDKGENFGKITLRIPQ
jgi:zinc-binding alcohol dehydrogenase/oxidoreductase